MDILFTSKEIDAIASNISKILKKEVSVVDMNSEKTEIVLIILQY